MLHQGNGKNLSMIETIIVSQDRPKILRSPVTCCTQRVKYLLRWLLGLRKLRSLKEVEILQIGLTLQVAL